MRTKIDDVRALLNKLCRPSPDRSSNDLLCNVLIEKFEDLLIRIERLEERCEVYREERESARDDRDAMRKRMDEFIKEKLRQSSQ